MTAQLRPYSQSELEDLEKDIYIRHRLGPVTAVHLPCLHEYKVKKGGRKEQHILKNNLDSSSQVLDDQTCSVCFKLRTNVSLDPHPVLPSTEEPLSRDKLLRIDSFYRWLYRHDF